MQTASAQRNPVCRRTPAFRNTEVEDRGRRKEGGTHRPGHVPRRERQTLPQLYKFGLKRTEPPPVVRRCMSGGVCGYSSGMKQSNSKSPPAYGVPSGPAIMILLPKEAEAWGWRKESITGRSRRRGRRTTKGEREAQAQGTGRGLIEGHWTERR